MAQSRSIQTNFTAGVMSPLLVARPDLSRYANAAADIRNFLPHTQGGLSRRSGTRYLADSRYGDRKTRLIPFQFSVEQSYALELGDMYIRFYRDRGQVTKTSPITAVGSTTQLDFDGDHTDAVAVGDTITINGSTSNDGDYEVASVTLNGSDTQITLTSAMPSTTADGTVQFVYAVSTPYDHTELRDIKFVQSADVLYLLHPAHQPRTLTRTSDNSWTLATFDFEDGPFLPVNTTTTTLDPSATSGSVTVVASATTGINDGAGFLDSDVGRLIWWNDGTSWLQLTITAVGSTTSVTASFKSGVTAAGHAATASWRLGTWCDTLGWPWCATFHESRLWFGGSNSFPQTVWGSVSSDFTNFQPSAADATVSDDDGVTRTIDDDQVNAIRWMLSDKGGLLIGTSGGEFVYTNGNDVITPSAGLIERQSSHGSHPQALPVRADVATLFVERFGFKIREMAYDFASTDRFVAADMNLLADHVAMAGPGPFGDRDDGIIQTAYQRSPSPVVWSITDNGRLLSMSYERDQRVAGWAEHPLGGFGGTLVSSNVEPPVYVESLCVIPDEPYDLLYLIVRREQSSGDTYRRTIEFVEDRFDHGDPAEDAFFVDLGLTYDGRGSASPGVYYDRIIADEPYLYYRLGEIVGLTAYDETGLTSGTYTNAPNKGVTGAIEGDANKAVAFNNSDLEAVNLGVAAALGSSMFSSPAMSVTIEAWVKAKVATPSAARYIFSGVNAAEPEIWVRLNADGTLEARLFDDNDKGFTLLTDSAVSDIADGRWHHIMVVMTFSSIAAIGSINYDGVTLSSTPTTSIAVPVASDWTGSGRVWIGALGSSGSPTLTWDGEIDEVSVYTKTMTGTQVTNHYYAGQKSVVQIASASPWTAGTTLTITSSAGLFASGDVGKTIRIYDGDGGYIDIVVASRTSSQQITGTSDVDVPASLRAINAADWAFLVSSISGLDHLDGEACTVVVDGAAHSDQTPSSGSITLDTPGAVVHVGLGYTSQVETMPLVVSSPVSTGGVISGAQAVVWLWRSSHFDVLYKDSSHTETVIIRRAEDPMDAGPPLSSEPHLVSISSDPKLDQRLVIQTDSGLPLTILNVSVDVDVQSA